MECCDVVVDVVVSTYLGYIEAIEREGEVREGIFVSGSVEEIWTGYSV